MNNYSIPGNSNNLWNQLNGFPPQYNVRPPTWVPNPHQLRNFYDPAFRAPIPFRAHPQYNPFFNPNVHPTPPFPTHGLPFGMPLPSNILPQFQGLNLPSEPSLQPEPSNPGPPASLPEPPLDISEFFIPRTLNNPAQAKVAGPLTDMPTLVREAPQKAAEVDLGNVKVEDPEEITILDVKPSRSVVQAAAAAHAAIPSTKVPSAARDQAVQADLDHEANAANPVIEVHSLAKGQAEQAVINYPVEPSVNSKIPRKLSTIQKRRNSVKKAHEANRQKAQRRRAEVQAANRVGPEKSPIRRFGVLTRSKQPQLDDVVQKVKSGLMTIKQAADNYPYSEEHIRKVLNEDAWFE